MKLKCCAGVNPCFNDLRFAFFRFKMPATPPLSACPFILVSSASLAIWFGSVGSIVSPVPNVGSSKPIPPPLEAGTPDTIMGRPVAISDSCDNMVATKIAVFFGDISYYWIAQRQGIVIKRLDELYSETDQVGFLATLRIDGELTLAESVHHMKMAAS